MAPLQQVRGCGWAGGCPWGLCPPRPHTWCCPDAPHAIAILLLTHFPPTPQVWFYFGVVGSFLFILIQLILLIDFAHSWSQLWLRNAGESNAKGWYAGGCCASGAHVGPAVMLVALLQPLPFSPSSSALCTVTFIFYAASIAAIALLYVYYTKPQGCTEGKVLISINLILCVIISAISILPKIQVRWQEGVAVLPPSCAGLSPEHPRAVCRKLSHTQGCCRHLSSPFTPSSSLGLPWPTSPVSALVALGGAWGQGWH